MIRAAPYEGAYFVAPDEEIDVYTCEWCGEWCDPDSIQWTEDEREGAWLCHDCREQLR